MMCLCGTSCGGLAVGINQLLLVLPPAAAPTASRFSPLQLSQQGSFAEALTHMSCKLKVPVLCRAVPCRAVPCCAVLLQLGFTLSLYYLAVWVGCGLTVWKAIGIW